MKKTLLAVFDIKPSGATSGAYTLVLEEVDGKRRKLPIASSINMPRSAAISSRASASGGAMAHSDCLGMGRAMSGRPAGRSGQSWIWEPQASTFSAAGLLAAMTGRSGDG